MEEKILRENVGTGTNNIKTIIITVATGTLWISKKICYKNVLNCQLKGQKIRLG